MKNEMKNEMKKLWEKNQLEKIKDYYDKQKKENDRNVRNSRKVWNALTKLGVSFYDSGIIYYWHINELVLNLEEDDMGKYMPMLDALMTPKYLKMLPEGIMITLKENKNEIN